MSAGKKRGAYLVLSVCACILGLGTSAAMGGIVTYGLNVEYAGDTPPEGSTPPPWLTAEFDDQGTAGSVVLTMTATNLVKSEAVKVWMFNLDPNMDPNDLVFSAPTKTGTFTDPTIGLGANTFKADGDGYFDINVAFDNSDGADNRFGASEEVSYTITGVAELMADSFYYVSAPDGAGTGLYPTAAHVISIGLNSGWVTVPEPCTLSLLGAGALLMLNRRRSVR